MKHLLLALALLLPAVATADTGRTVCKSAVPVLQTGGAYTTAYVAGGTLTFTNILRPAVGSGYVTGVVIKDKAKQDIDLELELFSANPGTLTDNAAYAPSSTVLGTTLASILLGSSTRYAFSANSIHYSGPLSNPVYVTPASGTLYGVVVARGAYTAASASDLTVTVCVSQD